MLHIDRRIVWAEDDRMTDVFLGEHSLFGWAFGLLPGVRNERRTISSLIFGTDFKFP